MSMPIASNGKETKTVRLKFLRQWPLFVMLLPALIWVGLFCYYPMYGAQIAFRDYKIYLGILESPWVGMKNFIDFFVYCGKIAEWPFDKPFTNPESDNFERIEPANEEKITCAASRGFDAAQPDSVRRQ